MHASHSGSPVSELKLHFSQTSPQYLHVLSVLLKAYLEVHASHSGSPVSELKLHFPQPSPQYLHNLSVLLKA